MTSVLKVDSIQTTSGSGFVIPPAGGIIQIQYDQYTGTDTQSFSAATQTEVDNLSVTITPTSTSSIIKLEAQLLFETSNATAEYANIFFFYRGSTYIGHPTAGSRLVGVLQSAQAYTAADNASTPSTLTMSYYDAPSTTSAVTYKIGANFHTATTFYLNRTVTDNDTKDFERGVSIISATEIAG